MTPSEGRPSRRRRVRALLVDVEPLRLDHDFRLLWLGQLVSGSGRAVTAVALPYELYVLTHSSLAVGALAVVQLVPILTFALGGGAVADAVDRRRLLILTQVGLMLTSVALAVLAGGIAGPNPPIALFYVVAFVAAGLGAIDQPARSSAIPRLVPRERLQSAIGLGQLSFQAIGVAGPALGGLLLASVGVATAFAFDAVTFLAALLALVLIRPLPPTRGAPRPSLGSIAEGLRFARAKRIVLATFVIDLDAMVFGMPSALFPALALDVFHAGPAGVGLLAAAPAVGAFGGALLTGWTNSVVRPGRAVIVAVVGWGAAIAAFGLAAFAPSVTGFALALVFLAVAGTADVISAVLRNAIAQFETPDELRGRVMSIHTLVVTSGPRLGDAEAAAVAGLFGPQLSVVSGGVLCLLGLVGVVRSFPELLTYAVRRERPEVVRAPFPMDAGPAEIDAGAARIDTGRAGVGGPSTDPGS